MEKWNGFNEKGQTVGSFLPVVLSFVNWTPAGFSFLIHRPLLGTPFVLKVKNHLSRLGGEKPGNQAKRKLWGSLYENGAI